MIKATIREDAIRLLEAIIINVVTVNHPSSTADIHFIPIIQLSNIERNIGNLMDSLHIKNNLELYNEYNKLK